jgi:hypothetical protein
MVRRLVEILVDTDRFVKGIAEFDRWNDLWNTNYLLKMKKFKEPLDTHMPTLLLALNG